MAQIVIENDCLTPEPIIRLTYNGPNPIKAYHLTRDFLRKIWEVEAKDYWEREFRWDNSSDPHEFVCKAYVDKKLDRFTDIIVEVMMQGFQPDDPKKSGTVEIKITGYLKSIFGGRNILEDARNPIFVAIHWIYFRYFYQNQLKSYLNFWCRIKLNELKRKYQEILGITAPS